MAVGLHTDTVELLASLYCLHILLSIISSAIVVSRSLIPSNS